MRACIIRRTPTLAFPLRVSPRHATCRASGNPSYRGSTLLRASFLATAPQKPSPLPPREFNEQRYLRSLNARMTSKLLNTDPLQALRTFDDTLRVGNVSPSISAWAAAIHAAGKAGHVEKALEYWQFLKSGKAPVDSKIVMPERPLSERLYIAIINVFAAHKRNEKVDELYRELHALARQVDKPASIEAARSAIYAAAASGRVEHALSLISSYSTPPPAELYTSLFSGLKTARMPREAYDVFAKRMHGLPEQRGVALVLSMHERDYMTACSIWKRYLGMDMACDDEAAAFVHLAMLQACLFAKQHGHALEVVQRIRTKNIKPNSAIYVAMMNVLLRRNELLQAVDVWTEARQGRIKMDPALLTQGLFVLCRAGRAEEALALLQVGEYHQLVDLHSINTVIFGALRLGRVKTAEDAFALIGSRNLKPDLHSLGPFVQYFSAADDPTNAIAYFERMQKLGIAADTPVVNAVVEMCTRLGHDDSLLKVYRQALNEAEVSNANGSSPVIMNSQSGPIRVN